MMRPVERGDTPKDGQGKAVAFAHYRDARDPLIRAIGDFCSYCEVALHSTIHVEHVRPKSLQPHLEREWTNFLLACDICNSIKGHEDVDLDDYLWPDCDNTARAFVYENAEPPKVNGTLLADQRDRTMRTLELTGLDRAPGHPKLTPSDRRWLKRLEVWGVALDALRDLRENDTPAMRKSIAHNAIARGFWSVWMQVFQDDPDM